MRQRAIASATPGCASAVEVYILGPEVFGQNDQGSHRTQSAVARAAVARHALARHFPAHRRVLSEGWRACGIAQPVAHPAVVAVAGHHPQRDERPRASRPDLCPAYLGRAPADADRPALLRRCLHGARRSLRRGTPRHRGAGARLWLGRDAGTHADRGQPDAVGHVARRRPGARHQERGGAEAHRVHPARADQGAGRDGVAERRCREPRRRPAGRHHRLAAARGLQLPQRPYQGPHAGRGAHRDRPHQGRDQGRARHAVAGPGRKRPGGVGRRRQRLAGAPHRARPRQPARKRHRPGRYRIAAGTCSRIWRRRTG